MQRGDTLYSIALAFGQDHRDLARWNGIEDPSRLAVGQLLRVEPPAAAAAVVPVAPVAAAQAIQAPFDREIIGGRDAPGRQRIQKTIDSLVQQSKDLVEAAAAIGITRLTIGNSK